jgi:putative membrane protein
MKTTNYFKQALLLVTFATAVFLITSCSNNQKPRDTKIIAEEHNDAEFDNNRHAKDAQFLVNAAEINLEQIQLGKLAQQVGRTTHVKELGKMMEDAHTKSLNDLTALANSKMITIPASPTDNTKEEYKKLNEKSGNDFDKAYADMMVRSHKDAIEIFEKASIDSYNTDIKNWASLALPDLRSQLDKSIDCQEKCSKM